MRTKPAHGVNMLETGVKEAKAKLEWVEEWVRGGRWRQGVRE